jgi:hypothetical protein
MTEEDIKLLLRCLVAVVVGILISIGLIGLVELLYYMRY